MEDLIMKKLIMFIVMLAMAAPALALHYADDAPDFAGCEGSASVLWEFLTDTCQPSSDEADPPYYYDPVPVVTPSFGGRHWDDPTDDSGWGGSYEAAPWEYGPGPYGKGVYTVLAEDSFNQTIPERLDKRYLRQYFQVVHTMVPGLSDEDYRWPIGLGLEVWDMTVQGPGETEWTGCPAGVQQPGDPGYRGGAQGGPGNPYELTLHYSLGKDGSGTEWFKTVWVNDFYQVNWPKPDTPDCKTEGAAEVELSEVTHTACIIGMDLDPDAGQTFQIEEITLDFIWFDDPCGLDIPTDACWRLTDTPAVRIDTEDIPVYEPQDVDTYGPPPTGPVTGNLLVSLNWEPGQNIGDPDFNAVVILDPNKGTFGGGAHEDFLIYPFNDEAEATEDDGVKLYFDDANWSDPQRVVVEARQDTDKEGITSYPIEVTVSIDIADPCFNDVMGRSIIVVDNDIPFVSATPASIELTEYNVSPVGTIDVRLSHEPASDVLVLVEGEGFDNVEYSKYSMFRLDPNFAEWSSTLTPAEPNHMTFTSHTAGTAGNPATWTPEACNAVEGGTYSLADMISCWNVPLIINVTAVDNEEVGEAWVEKPLGVVAFTPVSDDPWYRPFGMKLDEYGFPLEMGMNEQGNPKDSGGVAETVDIQVVVEDNDCGALGYDIADVVGGGEEGDEPDCIVNLADVAQLLADWTRCTQPYEAGCSKSWVYAAQDEGE
jgi:hypothetical protein